MTGFVTPASIILETGSPHLYETVNMKNFRNYRDLILVLTAKEIKVRYKNNVLGYLWSIANPLAFALVFFVAFKIFLKWDIKDYVLFLIAGLFPWQWFANSVGVSCGVFIGNASIIKKTAALQTFRVCPSTYYT